MKKFTTLTSLVVFFAIIQACTTTRFGKIGYLEPGDNVTVTKEKKVEHCAVQGLTFDNLIAKAGNAEYKNAEIRLELAAPPCLTLEGGN